MDLFSTENRVSRESVFVEFFRFASEVLTAYKPDAFNGEWKATKEEQQDVKEMLEAIIDTIHYAKKKRSKK